MTDPYVPVARLTTANTLLTTLETSLATIDDDSDAILADATSASAAVPLLLLSNNLILI